MNRLVCAFQLLQILFVVTIAKCPEGMVPSFSDNSTCYLFVTEKQSFLVAENFCNKKNGHLTSIHNAFENMFIREEAQQYFSSDFWIGLDDIKMPGTWTWMDGGILDFTDWDKGQPNKAPGNDCASVKLEGGFWRTDVCDNPKPFVCRTKIDEALTTTISPKKCPDSWSFYEITGYCYKVFHNATWENSENFCFSQGAHLASIHSYEEDIFIANMIQFDPNDHINDLQNRAWIGLFTITNQTDWIWIDHTPFNYSIWGPQRPCCPTLGAYCIGLRNGPVWGWPVGTWADDLCDDIFGHFICKKAAS